MTFVSRHPAGKGAVGLALLLQCLAVPSRVPACVVGTGTEASCTEAALDACLPDGGSFDGAVTFHCGSTATITVTGEKAISADTSIDGSGLITINGGNSVRIFYVASAVNVSIQNLTIANGNTTNMDSSGAAIYNDGTATITNCTFSGNTTPRDVGGGAIANGAANGATLTVINSTFSGNTSGSGGAIANSENTLTVANSTFSANNAIDHGRGGAIDNIGTLTVSNSTFSGNSASGGRGGAIGNGGGLVVVTNSTFSDNSANGGEGGAIFSDWGDLTVVNSTFSRNSASSGGAMYNQMEYSGPPLTVTNTIVANSTAGGNCSGTITDGGHNIDDGATCGFTSTNCATGTGSSFCNTDPQLDPTGPADNGGPTQTIALQAGSPAIDAGDPAVCANPPVNGVDQRGYARPGAGYTHCSIGAYEFYSPSFTCVGDCGGNDQVTVDELVTMVNIALGNANVADCEAGDLSLDGQITVDEILVAVNNALNGC